MWTPEKYATLIHIMQRAYTPDSREMQSYGGEKNGMVAVRLYDPTMGYCYWLL